MSACLILLTLFVCVCAVRIAQSSEILVSVSTRDQWRVRLRLCADLIVRCAMCCRHFVDALGQVSGCGFRMLPATGVVSDERVGRQRSAGLIRPHVAHRRRGQVVIVLLLRCIGSGELAAVSNRAPRIHINRRRGQWTRSGRHAAGRLTAECSGSGHERGTRPPRQRPSMRCVVC